MKQFLLKYLLVSIGVFIVMTCGIYLNNKLNQGRLDFDAMILFLGLSFGIVGCVLDFAKNNKI